MPTDDRWARADALFEAALELPAARRDAFLDEQCGDDAELRALVQRLLSHAESSGESFMTPGGGADLLEADREAADETSLSGTVVGRYRLGDELGRGGMAVVYSAERADGEFEQLVALKLIRRGIDTDDVVRRFERERQILARIQHPNIAGLLDGGSTADGRPFLVMERVEGQAIDRHCDERGLGIRDRLRLFLKVAEAVAHAHRRLVVHRDIKPSNILVDETGTVKLLDFGIARLLGPDTGDEQLTRTRQRLLTPAFASPEQVRGEPVTTSSDIYQLGVLLYVLLTSRLPYGGEHPGSNAFVQAILEREPTRPSAFASSVTDPGTETAASLDELSRRRDTTPAGLRRALAGDLDTILLTALRKEPDRRYGTVAELMEDIRCHLSGRPVSARPDTFGYRASKFVKRNRLAVGIAGVALVALVGFSVALAFQARRIAAERDRASLEAGTASRVSDFLVDLFKVTDPGQARGEEITAREVLDRGAERIEEELGDEPRVQARLMNTIGRVYQNLGLYDSALPLLERALEVRRTSDPDHEDVADSLNSLGWIREQRGDYAAAEPMYREALAIQQEAHGRIDGKVASTLNNLALVLYKQDKRAEAEPLFREALRIREELGTERSRQAADVWNNLGLLLQSEERFDEAEQAYQDSLEIRRELLGDDHPHVAISLDNLGRLAYSRGETEQAEELFVQALELRRRILGEDHPDFAQSLNNLGSVYFRQQDFAKAAPMFREVVAIDRRKLGADHPDYALSLGNLATVLQHAGDPREAEPLYREALTVLEVALGPEHGHVAGAYGRLGGCLMAQQRYAEAEPYLLESHARQVARLPEGHRRIAGAAEKLVELYEAWGRLAEADRFRPPPAEGD